MLKNKKAFAILATIVLIASVGIISANATENGAETPEGEPLCPFAGMRMGPGVGMHKGMMALDKETMEAGMEERLDAIREKLGLLEDATQEEIRNALREKMEASMEERLNTIKEKLDLPEDASEEEVKAALMEWREENMDLIMGFGRHGRFGPRCRRGMEI